MLWRVILTHSLRRNTSHKISKLCTWLLMRLEQSTRDTFSLNTKLAWIKTLHKTQQVASIPSRNTWPLIFFSYCEHVTFYKTIWTTSTTHYQRLHQFLGVIFRQRLSNSVNATANWSCISQEKLAGSDRKAVCFISFKTLEQRRRAPHKKQVGEHRKGWWASNGSHLWLERCYPQ